jgi:hypothetical protein
MDQLRTELRDDGFLHIQVPIPRHAIQPKFEMMNKNIVILRIVYIF